MFATRTYNFWILVYRAPDLPGQWIGHCLELDVVSQGSSIQQAIRMTSEASMLVALDDLNRGVDPLDRRAPEEEWKPLWRVVNQGEHFATDELMKGTGPAPTDELDEFAVQLIAVVFPLDRAEESAKPDAWKLPAAFARRRRSSEHACSPA